MTDDAHRPDRHADRRRPRQLLPRTTDGAHPRDPRERAGPGHRGLQLRLRQPDRHPEVGREGGPPARRASSGATATTRSSSRRPTEEPTMKRILILGGGVGGTLTANLLVKKLRRQVKAGEVTITVVDQTGQHTYQPGFMYIAMGGERAEHLQRPERGLLDSRVTLVVGEVDKVDETAQPRPPRRRRAARLRLPGPRHRLADRARGDRALRHRGPSLLHRRGGTRAPRGARRLHRRPDRDRHRRACPTSARRRRSRSRS